VGTDKYQRVEVLGKDTVIVTMENDYELVCDLSNGAVSNDLERSLTQILRSCQ